MRNDLISHEDIQRIESMGRSSDGTDPRLSAYVAIVNERMGVPNDLKDHEILAWKIAHQVPSVLDITDHLVSCGVERFRMSGDGATTSLGELDARHPGWEKAAPRSSDGRPHKRHVKYAA